MAKGIVKLGFLVLCITSYFGVEFFAVYECVVLFSVFTPRLMFRGNFTFV